MKCPTCGKDTEVLDTRNSPKGRRRRRNCLDCGKFTTYEVYASEIQDVEAMRTLLARIGALTK